MLTRGACSYGLGYQLWTHSCVSGYSTSYHTIEYIHVVSVHVRALVRGYYFILHVHVYNVI